MMKKKNIIIMSFLIIAAGMHAMGCSVKGTQPTTPGDTGKAPGIVTLATGLEVPWTLDFLPDGSMIFTERPGRVRLMTAGRELRSEPLFVVSDVAAQGEGGLLGIAVHPDFTANHFIYLYYTHENRVY